MIKLLIALFFLAFLSSNVHGQQLTKLSSDSARFNEQFKTYFLEKESLKEEDKAKLQEFIDLWNSGGIPESEKSQIRFISNALLKKDGSAFPHVYDYFRLILAFHHHPAQIIKQWTNIFIEIIQDNERKLKDVHDIIKFSVDLLYHNHLYASSSNSWIITADNYSFDYDDDFILRVENTDLRCYAKRDSITVYNTSGELKLFENRWYGKNGKVTYERAGYPADSVHANLNEYSIQMNKAEYSADSVKFIQKYYFDEPLYGSLTDRVMYIKNPSNATYPEFNSFQSDFYIRDIYPNINYDGGFTFEGAKVVGSGSQKEENVKLTLFNNNQPMLNLSSKSIFFYKDRVVSNRSEITIKLGNDSIYHPNLKFVYFVSRQELSILRNDDFISKTPYFSSYHQLYMNFEQLIWDCKTPILEFTALQSAAIANANFESSNYYNARDYYMLQRRDPVHPLIRLRDYSRKTKKRSFNAEDYADHLRLPAYQVKQQLLELTVEGYVIYEAESEMVQLNDKLFSTIKAHYDQIDYDIINIVSETNAPLDNATLNLNNFNLRINGVERVFLSDTQKVSIAPYGKKITVKKNRDFEFDGIVMAGLFRFYGDSFAFSYENFKIDLVNVDSMNMMAQTEEKNFYNDPVLVRINNTMENISGNLLIDEPKNKAGLEQFSIYPIFNSTQKSFVYYDDPYIQGGIYERESFYFEIYPYTLDSLDNFNTENLKFKGEFNSSDIFPSFEENLVIMPDNSLGFIRQTPATGFPVYQGKGKYYQTIKMSNEGLKGDGKIEYANSTTNSDEFLFLPEEMNSTARDFTVQEVTGGVQFPSVKGRENDIEWLPYEEELRSESNKEPFTMINEQTTLDGSILMKPTGITGSGKMNIENSELTSEGIYFDAQAFNTDEANFLIRDKNTNNLLFSTQQVTSQFDYDQRMATFEPNQEIASVRFPENQYTGLIEKFKWQMNEEAINMESTATRTTYIRGELIVERIPPEQGIPSGCHFYSNHPKQDSLDFYSPIAEYDLRNKVLFADQVHHLNVADALIYPKEGDIRVMKSAVMETLNEAEVLANRKNKHHEFYNANIDVKGKYDYSGSGVYNYVDKNGVNYRIKMNKIWVNDSIRTAAKGTISKADNFRLGPNFEFIGTAEMVGNKKNMVFDGATRISHNCKKLHRFWIKFKNEINPDSIYIPITEKPRNLNNGDLFSGVFYATDSMHIYPSFFSGRKKWSDHQLFSSKGYLYFDKNSQRYIISNKEKINNQSLPGPLISLHKSFCYLHGEDSIDLGVDYGQVEMNNFGEVNYNTEKNSFSMNLFLTLDFFMHNQAMEIMANKLDSLPLSRVDVTSDAYIHKLQEITGSNEARKLTQEMKRTGQYNNLPDELDKTLVFNDLNLTWSQKYQSFRSQGKIGIAMVDGRPINKYVNGNIEIIPYRSGDRLNMYLKASDNHWYYFSYFRNVMRTYSTNDDFIRHIKEERSRRRKLNVDWGEPSYLYILSTESSMNKVLERFKESDDKDTQENQNQDSDTNIEPDGNEQENQNQDGNMNIEPDDNEQENIQEDQNEQDQEPLSEESMPSDTTNIMNQKLSDKKN